MALLTALALIIFMVEAQLPDVVPIPGVKLGLANIVTLFALFAMTPGEALMILLARVILGSLFSGQPMIFFYSLAGGLAAFAVSLALRRVVGRGQIWVCGVVGAAAHNLGQLVAAALIARTAAVFFYLPFLLVCGMAAGLFTGLAAQALLHKLAKLFPRGHP